MNLTTKENHRLIELDYKLQLGTLTGQEAKEYEKIMNKIDNFLEQE